MPNSRSQAVSVPLGQVVAVDRCRVRVIQDLEEIRLALRALSLDSPRETRLAFLRLVDGQLQRIGQQVDQGLQDLPQRLLRQA